MKRLIENFKALPAQTRGLLGAGAVLALFVALPLFLYAVLNGNFELRRFASGEVPTPTPAPNLNPPLCGQTTISPPTGAAPLTVTLFGSGNAGSGPGIDGYRWDFENNGTWDTGISINPVDHTYSTPGTYQPVFQVHGVNNVWSNICTYPYQIVAMSDCISHPQTATLTPNNQTGAAGTTLTYSLTLTNNDSVGCSTTRFNFSTIIPSSSWSTFLSAPGIDLSPQASGSATISFTSPVSASPGSYPVGVNIASVMGTIGSTATYTVGNVCLPSDINKDGLTDITDYSILVSDFFKVPPTNPRSDVNRDGIVDITDYSIFVSNFFRSTGACR